MAPKQRNTYYKRLTKQKTKIRTQIKIDFKQ